MCFFVPIIVLSISFLVLATLFFIYFPFTTLFSSIIFNLIASYYILWIIVHHLEFLLEQDCVYMNELYHRSTHHVAFSVGQEPFMPSEILSLTAVLGPSLLLKAKVV